MQPSPYFCGLYCTANAVQPNEGCRGSSYENGPWGVKVPVSPIVAR